jgi:hypothetical protein
MLNTYPEDFPKASEVQLAVIKLMLAATTLANFSELPVRSNATETLSGGKSQGLPGDQWIFEVLHMSSFVWSALQTITSDYAVGPAVRALDTEEAVDEPTTSGQKDLCRAQKMRKSGGFAYATITTFALLTADKIIGTLTSLG